MIETQHRKWWVIIATSLALAMIFVDMSALPIALPRIQTDLNTTPSVLRWIINAYLLSLAVLIILGGKLGDKVGHRKVFVSGAALFIFSSVLCAMANSSQWMIMGRILQGVGGAMMMPSASPLFRSVVEPEEIGKMAGIYVSFASIFLILGPTLGGFLTEYLSWHWIFWLNFPLGIVAISIVMIAVPKDTPLKKFAPFDWIGFWLLTICLIALVYALMEAPNFGWSSPLILSCFSLSVITAIIFLRIEKKQQHPFLELNLFKNKYFTYSICILLLMQCIFMSAVFWAIFFQEILNLSAANAGLFMLAAQAPIFVSSHIAGRMFDRFGPRLPTLVGGTLITVSGLWITLFCWKANIWWLLPGLMLFGIGSPFINLTNISSVVSAVPAEQRGMASGISSAVRQVGGAIGLAVLGAFVTQMNLYYLESSTVQSHLSTLTALNLNHVLSHSTMHLSEYLHDPIVFATVKKAYILSFSVMMGVVSLFGMIILILANKLPGIARHKHYS